MVVLLLVRLLLLMLVLVVAVVVVASVFSVFSASVLPVFFPEHVLVNALIRREKRE